MYKQKEMSYQHVSV